MSPFAAVTIDPQMHGEAGAVFVRSQRAQPVRQRLGQHRNDTVGEIDRIAAQCRLAVERAAGRDVPRNIGDGDDEVPATGIFRIGVRLGPDRVVEIARVTAVDRDQIELAQIGAAGGGDRCRRASFGQRGGREYMRDLETGDRYQADRTGSIGCAKALDDPEARWSVAAGGEGFGSDQLAIEGAPDMGKVDKIFGAVAAIGGNDPPAIMATPENPDDAA
jgi:hypothetical protein